MAEERFDQRLVFDKVKVEYARLLHVKSLLPTAAVRRSTEQ